MTTRCMTARRPLTPWWRAIPASTVWRSVTASTVWPVAAASTLNHVHRTSILPGEPEMERPKTTSWCSELNAGESRLSNNRRLQTSGGFVLELKQANPAAQRKRLFAHPEPHQVVKTAHAMTELFPLQTGKIGFRAAYQVDRAWQVVCQK